MYFNYNYKIRWDFWRRPSGITKAKENKGFFGVTLEKSKEDVVTANALKRSSQNKGFFGGTSAGGN